MVTLLDLGPDILALHILPLLDPGELAAVRLVCHQLDLVVRTPMVWHELYTNEFRYDAGAPSALSDIPADQWRSRFEARCRASVWGWGVASNGRLGVSVRSTDVPANARAPHYYAGLCRPVKALPDAFGRDAIVQLVGGCLGTAALTEHGQIVVAGEVSERIALMLPRSRPVHYSPLLLRGAPVPLGLPAPTSSSDQQLRLGQQQTPPPRRVRTDFSLHVEDGSPKFVQVALGRHGLLALDSEGYVWAWHLSKNERGQRLHFAFEVTGARVVKVCAYWNVFAVITDTAGLCLWWHMPADWPEQTTVDYVTVSWTPAPVPPTGEWHVTDAAVGAGFAVFVTASGQLFCVAAGDSVEFEHFDPVPLQGEEGLEHKFVKVAAGYNRIAALTDTGRLILAKHTINTQFEPPHVCDLPDGDRCVDMALGDHHQLALGASGSVYSWGSESQDCGSLGLGGRTDLAALGARERPVHRGMALDHDIDHPTKVAIGPAVQIAAGGWQSLALVL